MNKYSNATIKQVLSETKVPADLTTWKNSTFPYIVKLDDAVYAGRALNSCKKYFAQFNKCTRCKKDTKFQNICQKCCFRVK